MRLLLIIVGAIAAIVSVAKPAEANWCAHYNMGGGATNCGFKTHHMLGSRARSWRVLCAKSAPSSPSLIVRTCATTPPASQCSPRSAAPHRR